MDWLTKIAFYINNPGIASLGVLKNVVENSDKLSQIGQDAGETIGSAIEGQSVVETLGNLVKMLASPGGIIGSIGKYLIFRLSAHLLNLFQLIYNIIIQAEQKFFEVVNGNIFSEDAVGFLAFFQRFGYLLWAAGFVVAILEFALNSQKGPELTKTFVMNFMKSFLAVNLFVQVPRLLFEQTNNLSQLVLNGFFNNSNLDSLVDSTVTFWTEFATNALTGEETTEFMDLGTPLLFLGFMLMVVWCLISIGLQIIQRGALLFVQIAAGSLYMFGAPRGYDDGLWAWCKQVVALCFTGFVQKIMMIWGLMISFGGFAQFSTENIQSGMWVTVLVGIGFLLAAKHVPEIAREFGMNAGADTTSMGGVINTGRSVVHSSTRAVSGAIHILK